MDKAILKKMILRPKFGAPNVENDQYKYHILIIKSSSTGPSSENQIIYKFLSQHHKHLHRWKLEKPNSWKQPIVNCSNGWR